MIFIGHVLLAITPVVVISSITDIHIGAKEGFYLLIIALFALVPDIDEKGSYIGRKLTFIAVLLEAIGVKHRTITHWALIPVILIITSTLMFGVKEATIYFSISYGMLMHSAGDMLTKGGIKGFFFPFFKEKTIRILPYRLAFYTGSSQEYVFILLLLLINIGALLHGVI